MSGQLSDLLVKEIKFAELVRAMNYLVLEAVDSPLRSPNTLATRLRDAAKRLRDTDAERAEAVLREFDNFARQSFCDVTLRLGEHVGALHLALIHGRSEEAAR